MTGNGQTGTPRTHPGAPSDQQAAGYGPVPLGEVGSSDRHPAAEAGSDAVAMVNTLWAHGGDLTELLGRLQMHSQRASVLAREAEELRQEMAAILRKLYLGQQ
jgi:hypothetical protein